MLLGHIYFAYSSCLGDGGGCVVVVYGDDYFCSDAYDDNDLVVWSKPSSLHLAIVLVLVVAVLLSLLVLLLLMQIMIEWLMMNELEIMRCFPTIIFQFPH